MSKLRPHTRLTSWAVLLVFLAGWSVGTLHRLLIHRHANPQECSASYEPGATHIHDETYAKEHCSLCAFVLSTPELLSITAVLPEPGVEPATTDSFPCTPSCTDASHDTTCLRGPPVL